MPRDLLAADSCFMGETLLDDRSLVSVIIPAFNAQDFIGETIQSILAQSYRNIEIVIVDDGSTDLTADVVKSFGSQVIYHRQENSGGCAVPRNTGIGISSGDLLCFLDADDLMAPDRISRQVCFLENNAHVGMVFSDYRNFNSEGSYPESHFQTCPRLQQRFSGALELILERAGALIAVENFGIAGSFLMRRNLLLQEEGFEPSLTACEDFHFYFRLTRLAPVGLINQVGMLRRMHGTNMSSNTLKMMTEGIRCGLMLRKTESDPVSRQVLSGYISSRQQCLARHYANQRRYANSFVKDWQALFNRPCFSQVRASSRNIARTTLIAMGLFKPTEEK